MRVCVTHELTKDAAIPVMDQALDKLLGGVGSGSIQILNQKKSWNDSVMTFSFTGKVGFISVPLTGTIEVATSDVAVNMDLPPVVQTFIGEEKIRTIVETNVRELLDDARSK
jgi:hypothetical protein